MGVLVKVGVAVGDVGLVMAVGIAVGEGDTTAIGIVGVLDLLQAVVRTRVIIEAIKKHPTDFSFILWSPKMKSHQEIICV